MSQLSALRNMDAIINSVLAKVGMSDAGTYTAPGGSPIACTFLVDRNVIEVGDRGQAIGQLVHITLFIAQVGKPRTGAVVTLTSGEAFHLEADQDTDESKSKWTVESIT